MREKDVPVHDTYAEALIDAVRATGRLDATFEEAIQLSQILKAHPELPRFLEKPAIRNDEKKALIRTVFEGRLSTIMLHLGLLLVDKHRGAMWRDILNRFVELVERERGIFAARVDTAHELSMGERERLKESLERFTKQHLRIRYQTEEDLIGGVRFRYGDMMIDNTVRAFLSQLRVRLERVKVH